MQNEKWNSKAYQCEFKDYHKCKTGYSWNLNTCIYENNKYLKKYC